MRKEILENSTPHKEMLTANPEGHLKAKQTYMGSSHTRGLDEAKKEELKASAETAKTKGKGKQKAATDDDSTATTPVASAPTKAKAGRKRKSTASDNLGPVRLPPAKKNRRTAVLVSEADKALLRAVDRSDIPRTGSYEGEEIH